MERVGSGITGLTRFFFLEVKARSDDPISQSVYFSALRGASPLSPPRISTMSGGWGRSGLIPFDRKGQRHSAWGLARLRSRLFSLEASDHFDFSSLDLFILPLMMALPVIGDAKAIRVRLLQSGAEINSRSCRERTDAQMVETAT